MAVTERNGHKINRVGSNSSILPSPRKAYLHVVFLFWIVGDVHTCPDVPKLKTLPGSGWDALTNKDAKQVTRLTYDRCQLTNDGRLLIPDNTLSEPLNSQKIDIKTQIFDHWSNYTAPTSAGFKMATDVWPDQFLPLYYSFSDEHREMKSLRAMHGAFICRSEMRQVVYRLRTTRDATIDEAVGERFERIFAALARNNTEQTKYLIGTFVRDYGTHYTLSVDVGALLVKDDYLGEGFLRVDDVTTNDVLSASKLSLLEYTDDFSRKRQRDVDATLLSKYNKAVLAKRIRFFGGLDWEDEEIPEYVVAVDKSGDLMSDLVTSTNFPSVPTSALVTAKQMFGDVIRDYYERNIHRGCTRPKSSNFEMVANLDDGSCTAATSSNYLFGGVYATCDEYYLNAKLSTCQHTTQRNPLTKTTSCPINFEPSIVFSRIYVSGAHGSFNHAMYKQQTFFSCLTNESIGVSYLFGGLYSPDVDNIHTKNNSCPPFYTAISSHAQLGSLSICVNYTDGDSAKRYALPFGGFASSKNEYECPMGYKKHLAIKFNDTVLEQIYRAPEFTASFRSDENIYYCLQEDKKFIEQIAKLIQPPFQSGSDCIKK